MVLRLNALAPPDRMGVVKTYEAFAIRTVKGQRIIDALRLPKGLRYAGNDKPNPMPAVRVHYENLPVEIEQHIEGGIAPLRHTQRLSE